MIGVSAQARSVLGRGRRYHVRAQSWLGGDLLHDDVPVTAGTEEGDRSLAVPTRVSLTVPQTRRGFDWTPTADDHPLAANGQQLHLQLGLGVGPDGIEWLDRGVFVITDSRPDGRGGVAVEASDLLWLVSEASYASPYQPSGTLVSTLRGLVEPALTVVVDDAPADRSVPADVNYAGSRLDAVTELLDAWPADAVVTPDGALTVTVPSTPSVAQLVLTPQVIRRVGNSTRDGGFNVVVAKGRDSNGADIQGTAYVTSGPRVFGGPWNPLAVTYEYASPLLTTVAQCQAAARTVRDRLLRRSGRTWDVDIPPDPSLQLGDAVEVAGVLCTVEGLRLPYVPDTMTVRVRSLS